MKKGKNGFYCKYVKRILDIICALVAMIVFCWAFAIVAILVRVKLGSPVIFKQQRPGRIDPRTGKERIFTLYKFRSMTDQRDENGDLLSNEKRLTKLGKFLRSTSLDELPEVFNIIKGDMSIIGPRPLRVKYLLRYNDFQRRRHEIRPGLSGLAQVNGRNTVTWEEKFKYDITYAENISFWGDVKILCLTFIKTLKREGIVASAEVVMPEFMGEQGSVIK